MNTKNNPRAADYFDGGKSYKPKRKKQSPTNELTKAVLKLVRSKPQCFAWRVNSTGVVRNGQYTYSGATSGVPDVEACIAGKYVGFEIKVGRDKMRESQIKFKEKITEANGVYVIVKEIDDVINYFSEIDF